MFDVQSVELPPLEEPCGCTIRFEEQRAAREALERVHAVWAAGERAAYDTFVRNSPDLFAAVTLWYESDIYRDLKAHEPPRLPRIEPRNCTECGGRQTRLTRAGQQVAALAGAILGPRIAALEENLPGR